METAQQFITSPSVPVVPRIDVFAASIPARTYTGDFYRYSRTDDNGLLLIVGDVSGKGIHAAVYMAMIQEELERLNERRTSPCAVIREMNAILFEHMPRNRFATMVTARIGPTGDTQIVNAGHLPVLIRRTSGAVDVIKANGSALGMFDTGCWKGETTRLERGDILIAYSDGLVEASSSSNEEFGLDRLITAVAALSPDSPRDVASSLLATAHAFAGSWTDDVTISAVQMN